MTDAPMEQAAPKPQMTKMQRWWDSDFMYSFRHAPVAVVSFIVVVILVMAAVCAPPSEGNTVALVYPPPSSPWSTGSPVMRMSEHARNHSCGPQPTPCVPSSQ